MKSVFLCSTVRCLASNFAHGRIRQNPIHLSPIQSREPLFESPARFAFERRQRLHKIPLMLFVIHAQQQINESVHPRLLRPRNNPLRKDDQCFILLRIQESWLPIRIPELFGLLEDRTNRKLLVNWMRAHHQRPRCSCTHTRKQPPHRFPPR